MLNFLVLKYLEKISSNSLIKVVLPDESAPLINIYTFFKSEFFIIKNFFNIILNKNLFHEIRRKI